MGIFSSKVKSFLLSLKSPPHLIPIPYFSPLHFLNKLVLTYAEEGGQGRPPRGGEVASGGE